MSVIGILKNEKSVPVKMKNIDCVAHSYNLVFNKSNENTGHVIVIITPTCFTNKTSKRSSLLPTISSQLGHVLHLNSLVQCG